MVRQAGDLWSANADGTGFHEQTYSIAIQSEAALRTFSVIGIPFASASERVEFRYLRVRHADGTTTETPLDTALEQPEQVTREAPLYSDLKQKQLPVRGLRVGDTLEWQVHIERFKPEAPGEFWGQQSILAGAVVLAQTVELRVPASRPVTVWTNPRSALTVASSVEGQQRVYRWKTSALDPTTGPEAEAAVKSKTKKVFTAEEQVDSFKGKLPDIAWTSFADWAAVGSWYRTLEAGRTQPDEAIRKKIAELTAGKASLQDKVQAVYSYVSSQVHYIGVDLGVGRFQPHGAGEVLESQYGDCKDKHTLLAAMLSVLGLHPDAVLIGSGLRFNPAVPSPASFNHLITHVVVDGTPVWLDATAGVAPYRMLVATIRDQQALVIPDGGPATIEQTPADPPFPTFETMTATGALDKEGVSESHFTLTLRGDEELLLRAILQQVTPAQYDEFTGRVVANMGFSGTVSHARFLHLESSAEPLTLEWDYHREKAGDDWANLRTLPQLMIVMLPAVDEKTPPMQAFKLFGARTVTSTSELKLPPGWSAELPEAIHAKSEFGTYDLTFRYGNGTLYSERRWTLLKEEVQQAEWKKYKAWTDAFSMGSEPFVQLRQASLDKPAGSTQKPGGGSDEESARLLAEASKAMQENRMDDATALLDKVKAKHPQARGLWAGYGSIAFKRGNHLDAIEDYNKELESYPDEAPVSLALSRLQWITGDRDAAIVTLQRFVAAAPDNPNAAASLIATLLKAGKNKEAAAAADAALTRLPAAARTEPPFLLGAGEAHLRGGEPEKGAAELDTLLGSTTDPLVMNNAAYLLADANRDLPAADSAERTALAKLGEETRSWTLDESLGTLRGKSSLLAAAWDTMGWILYREGKLDEAEAFIHARWLYSPDTEVGMHLGDVQLARGRKAEALESYRLALATVPRFNDLGVRKTGSDRKVTDPKAAELEARIAKLGGPAKPADDGTAALHTLHTVTLPFTAGLAGAAPYKLLISAKGVQRAEPAGAEEVKGGAALLQQATMPALLPPGSDALLVESGKLTCLAGHCELVLTP